MRCLFGTKLNMKADILRQAGYAKPSVDPTPAPVVNQRQDPDTGEIIREWEDNFPDNPNTPEDESGENLETVACLARGIIDGGIRVAGTTERFDDLYSNIDYVSMTVGPETFVTKRDRITNIRDSEGVITWVDEEATKPTPTVFNVLGVTPVLDMYSRVIEQRVMLERAS